MSLNFKKIRPYIALLLTITALSILIEKAVVAKKITAVYGDNITLAQNSASESELAAFISEYDNEEPPPDAEERRAMAVSKLLPEMMPEIHITHKKFDEKMSMVAWTNYLDSLDFDRVYFIRSDIDEFKHYENSFHKLMQNKDLSFAKLVFERFRERVSDRVEFIRANVTNNFDFTTSDEYVWKRKNMPWPADKEELDSIWIKRIANSILAYRVNSEISNEKNTKHLAEIRIDIARELRSIVESDTNTNKLAEIELTNELAIFDTAIAALDHTPTNTAERLELQKNLMFSTTNKISKIEAVTTAAAGENETSPSEENSATNRLTTLIQQYTFVENSIKTPEKTVSDAAKETLDNYVRFENILKDSDQEFYLGRYFNAMTTAYDPHSNYLSPVTLEDFGIDMQLSLQGIGAQLQSEDGAAKIMEIIPGSPAERDQSDTKLVPGDKIIGVAQGDEEFVDIRHWPLYKAVRLIRGPKGSTVRLQVIPANDPNGLKVVILVRDEIKLEEQAASSRIEKISDENGVERKLGYIKLPTFYSSMNIDKKPDVTPRSATIDVASLIAELNSEEVEGLILDLRNNGGGSLPEAVYLTGLFIRTGPVVQVKEARRTIPLPDNDPAIAFDKPLVVMVNKLSASASEIVAGALQDYGRAVIVGDSSTHGKGTVQTLIPLADGKLGSLKTTTASFYRINGSSTQIRGVESDIVLPSAFDYFSDLGEGKLDNPIPWSRTGPARYRVVDPLEDVIPTLRERSEKRRQENEKWCNHMKILERFGVFSTNKVFSLNFEERLAKAREDEELNRKIADDTSSAATEMGDSIIKQEEKKRKTKEEKEKEARKRDMVRDETLNILLDLIDLHGSPRNLRSSLSPYDFLDSFFR